MHPSLSNGVHVFLAGAAIGADISPVPMLSTVIRLIDQFVTSCERVGANDQTTRSLKQQSKSLTDILAEVNQANESEKTRRTIHELYNLLKNVTLQAQNWESYGTVKSWVLQAQITEEITKSTARISTLCSNLMLQLQIATKAGVDNANNKLVEIAQNQEKGFDAVHDDMEKIQVQLGKMVINSDQHKLAAKTLYNIQVNSRKLLPDVELKAGEVLRTNKLPIGGTAEFDFYEGMYLAEQKCMLKSIRCASFDDKRRNRLKREVGIWRNIYELDHGEYFVPFYGVCYFEEPYPCLVSPFYKNGDIQEFIRKNPSVDRIYIIRHIAEGLKLLHSQTPPIIHGELRASKILVADDGTPLVADFGLSKIIDDATGAPYTRTNVSADQYRWFAPEVCSDQFVLMPASDVYSYAMVVLEIMTGSIPFSEIKRSTEIVPKVLKGEKPLRPTGNEVIEYGLSDELWALLTRCWLTDPNARPTFEDIIQELVTMTTE